MAPKPTWGTSFLQNMEFSSCFLLAWALSKCFSQRASVQGACDKASLVFIEQRGNSGWLRRELLVAETFSTWHLCWTLRNCILFQAFLNSKQYSIFLFPFCWKWIFSYIIYPKYSFPSLASSYVLLTSPPIRIHPFLFVSRKQTGF